MCKKKCRNNNHRRRFGGAVDFGGGVFRLHRDCGHGVRLVLLLHHSVQGQLYLLLVERRLRAYTLTFRAEMRASRVNGAYTTPPRAPRRPRRPADYGERHGAALWCS
ncbi:hypothetical protein EVAR_49339_1 [Eumeta japonica]|uniref:Uncharacterized protein n=1 Tax=Eumeta variegata TaxID=151549 RepID=A0A4C1XZ20_EUMVA|nr:hypothetical protein EVAR_49339_1 [Eumeta japonica]